MLKNPETDRIEARGFTCLSMVSNTGGTPHRTPHVLISRIPPFHAIIRFSDSTDKLGDENLITQSRKLAKMTAARCCF